MNFSWMAWTPETAAFFIVIFFILIGMTIWEYFSPGGNPRKGILGINTTRGDRLFISLLTASYIHLLWLWLFTYPLWIATGFCLLFSILVFRKV